MLTEYKGSIFNAEIIENTVRLWKYIPVNGFSEVKTKRGITFYEKTIDINEVDSFLV